MRIAIPVVQGRLSAHFGHCESFVLIDVDESEKLILEQTAVSSPPHAPGALPVWLAEQGANVILSVGMGSRAIQLFEERGIQVVLGAPKLDPEALVHVYLAGDLGGGTNVCDH
jgi:predicted Fe-Mo cluster-binding NifX family protein